MLRSIVASQAETRVVDHQDGLTEIVLKVPSLVCMIMKLDERWDILAAQETLCISDVAIGGGHTSIPAKVNGDDVFCQVSRSIVWECHSVVQLKRFGMAEHRLDMANDPCVVPEDGGCKVGLQSSQ